MATYSLDSIVPSKLQQQFEIHPLYWNNPLNRDEQERRQAINYCRRSWRTLPLHLDECRPGLGYLNYRVFLKELQRVDPDMPLMLEHSPGEEDYTLAIELSYENNRNLCSNA